MSGLHNVRVPGLFLTLLGGSTRIGTGTEIGGGGHGRTARRPRTPGTPAPASPAICHSERGTVLLESALTSPGSPSHRPPAPPPTGRRRRTSRPRSRPRFPAPRPCQCQCPLSGTRAATKTRTWIISTRAGGPTFWDTQGTTGRGENWGPGHILSTRSQCHRPCRKGVPRPPSGR